MLGSGVHVHSKVIVLDPFGANPVVMTGSHNLGFETSSANDDNLMIVEGNAPLAAAYAANIIAIYQAYRWNAYVEAHRQDLQVWHGLVDNDTWQNGYLAGPDLDEIKFWLGTPDKGGPPPPPPPPPPGGTPAKIAVATGPAPAKAGGKTKTASKKTPAKKTSAKKKKAPAREGAGAKKKKKKKKRR